MWQSHSHFSSRPLGYRTIFDRQTRFQELIWVTMGNVMRKCGETFVQTLTKDYSPRTTEHGIAELIKKNIKETSRRRVTKDTQRPLRHGPKFMFKRYQIFFSCFLHHLQSSCVVASKTFGGKTSLFPVSYPQQQDGRTFSKREMRNTKTPNSHFDGNEV